MKGTILLIDDEGLVMEFYIRALKQKNFEVKQFFGPDTTFEFLEKDKPNLTGIILDVMMLPGKMFQDQDTHEGLRTGVFLYNQLRSLYPKVPIIVLTNVSNQKTLQALPDDPLLKTVQKLEYPPFELTELLIEMIQSATNSELALD